MIDISYFAWRDVRIPNITDDCKDRLLYINAFIKSLEEECLIRTLGVCLYQEYKTELDSSGNLLDTADPKWGKLLFGEVYNISSGNSSCSCGCGKCKKHYWKGIFDRDNKRSYIAYYIFNKWAFENESQSFSTGKQIAKVNNSKTISNQTDRINAWNEFVSWVNYGFGCSRVSLYHYLKDKETDFPDHSGEYFKHINVWNI